MNGVLGHVSALLRLYWAADKMLVELKKCANEVENSTISTARIATFNDLSWRMAGKQCDVITQVAMHLESALSMICATPNYFLLNKYT